MRNLLGHPRIAPVMLAYTRPEFLHWDRLLRWAEVGWEAGDKPEWKRNRPVFVRGKQHGFLMKLDLSDWCQRQTYFTGRYYEKHVLLALDIILRPGDHFVDIGANIGMMTLHARGLVGASGSIDSFEPNPPCAAAIRDHLSINHIENVTLHQCALSDARGTLTLRMTSDHTGTATLADVGAAAVGSTTVDVRVADEEIGKPPRLIKIDVEGFEVHVLKGLLQTLKAHRPFVIMEVLESHLRRAGSSTDVLFEYMRSLGYMPFGIDMRRRRLRNRLILTPLASRQRGEETSSDVLWVPPGNSFDATPYLVENL